MEAPLELHGTYRHRCTKCREATLVEAINFSPEMVLTVFSSCSACNISYDTHFQMDALQRLTVETLEQMKLKVF